MEDIVFAEIDLSAVGHNLGEVKKLIPDTTKIMAVVKANGYGHGSYEVAKEAVSNGVTSLAVARLDEALYLRKKGIDVDILIFGFVPASLLPVVMQNNLIVTLYDMNQVSLYKKYCSMVGKKLRGHVKVDTGMGRLGFVLSDQTSVCKAMTEIYTLLEMEEFSVEGIYTHFACADEEDLSYSRLQLDRFNNLIYELKKRGYSYLKFHAANSAAIMQLPESHLDMVRPGIMLYGLYPSDYLKRSSKVRLIPAMSLKARVAQIKEVSAGFKISYGSTYITEKKTTLATIPVGYADGYPRILSSKGYILVKGELCPIRGRVCMDQMVVDVTGTHVKIGDVVTIFGKDNSYELSADDVSKWANTINYEIVSQITQRVKRVYLRDKNTI